MKNDHPDLFRPETREKKRRLYAAAHRYAVELPGKRGKTRKQVYALMIGNLLGALRA